MSEQRVELWALVRKGLIRTYYRSGDLAIEQRQADEDVIRLVEIRDGDRIVGPEDSAPWSVVEGARRERDAAIERAEKAEKAWHYLVKTIDDANTNERARYERETAARLLAGFVTRDPMPKDATE